MPVSTQYVKFVGRKPSPAKLRIAMQGDHNAEILHLDIPCIAEDQTAMLFVILPDGSAGDTILIDEYGNVDFTRTLTQFSGLLTGYVQINVSESIVWHSDILYLEIGALPDIEKGIEEALPSAFEQVLETMTNLLSNTQTSANEAVNSAKEGKNSEIVSERDARFVEETALQIREYVTASETARREAVDANEHAQHAKDASEESMNIAVHKAAEAEQNAQRAMESEQEVTRLEYATRNAKEQADAAAAQAVAAAEEAMQSRIESRNAREDAQIAQEAKHISIESREVAVQAKDEAVSAKEETLQNAIAAGESAQYAMESEQAALRSELAAWYAQRDAERARDAAQEYGQRIAIDGTTLIIGGE